MSDERSGKSGDKVTDLVGDMVKKVLTVGVGAIFLTEESLRSLIKQYKIPKEMISGLLDSASSAKTEFLKNFSDEIIKQVSSKVNARELLEEFFQKNEIDLQVKIKFSKRKD